MACSISALLNAIEAACTASALIGPWTNWSIISFGIVGSSAAGSLFLLVVVGWA